MKRPTLANPDKCTGCLACVDGCTHEALSKEIGADGHIYVKCNTDKCILCHRCEKTCPVVSDYTYHSSETPYYYAAWCKDNTLRQLSASGGAFAGMAKHILLSGGYVVGAANVGVCDIKHIIIESIEDLHNLQGSKYTQSDATGSYSSTMRLLKEGKTVLFSGTGCQVAGLLSYLGTQKFVGKLITVDLICGGVPSKLLVNTFIDNEPYKVEKIISFRTKDTGWKSSGFLYNMKVLDDNGHLHDYTGVKNLVTNGFCSELTNRYSCYDCKYSGASRKSDFTIGDYWGDTAFTDQHYNGLSVVIAHGKDSCSLLMEMSDCLQLERVSGENVAQHNPRLINGKMKGASYFERKYISKIFAKLSYSTLLKIYGNDISLFSPWFIYKILRKIRSIL